MWKNIEEIGICRGCFEKPALYQFTKSSFLLTQKRYLCKDCMKELCKKEDLGINF